MITGLYEKSGNFGLSREHFAAVLNEIASKYLAPGASPQEMAELYAGLRVEELALARACAAGSVLNTVAVARSPRITRTHWPSFRSMAG